MSHTINQNRARAGLPPLTDEEIEQVRKNPPKTGSAVKPPSIWCTDMAKAPRDRRILVQADPSGKVYAAKWVENVFTGHQAWLIAQLNEEDQLICQAKAWAEIPEVSP